MLNGGEEQVIAETNEKISYIFSSILKIHILLIKFVLLNNIENIAHRYRQGGHVQV